MSIKRRQFLILSSLGGLGLAVLGKIFRGRTTESTAANSTDTTNLASKPSTSTSADALRNPVAGQPLLRFVSVADTGTGATGQYAVAGGDESLSPAKSLRFGSPSR
jgi:acid phosphatase